MAADEMHCAGRYVDRAQRQLGDLVIAIRGKLNKIQRKVISALIVIEVHAKDVSIGLRDDGIDTSQAFEWIKQLRCVLPRSVWRPVIR